MKIKRVDPNAIIVKFNKKSGRIQGRIQTVLNFVAEYADALRLALGAVSEGHTNVSLIQRRSTLHNHSDLAHALPHIPKNATDLEVIEEVHHATRKPQLWPSFSINTDPLSWAS